MKKDIRDSVILIVKRAIGANSYLDQQAQNIVMDCDDIDNAAEMVVEDLVDEFPILKRYIV